MDADASKLEHWISDNERAISKRPDLTNTPYVDKLEKELVKLKLFNNEISEQQAKLVTLTQSSDQIGLSLAPDGAAALKDRINAMKGKISKLSETVRGKINSISDAIMARQDFNAKMANFSNWMDQLRGQVAQVEEINAERVEPSLQTVHALLQEHSEIKPVFSAIRDEVKELTQRATPEESLIINDSYAALVSNYDDIENDLQRKKGSLEKWSELMGWKNETEGHISHIKHQLEKADKVEPQNLSKIVAEIDEVTKSVSHWKSQAMQIDDNPVIHLRDMVTRKPLSAVQIVNDLGNKLDALKLKSQGQMDVIHKMEERKSRFNNLENQLVTHLTQNQQKLAEILRNTPNFLNIDQIISDLVALNEVMQKQASLKDKIHDEGVQLMKDDISSMPAIQESMLVLDKNWDGLQQEIVDRIQKYTIISQGLKEYADAKDRFGKELQKALTIYQSVPSAPSGEQQLLQTADKSKKALEQIKKSKGTLDELERKGHALLKLFDAIENVIPNEIATEMETSHKDWQQLYDKISKNAHIYETEAVIWNQIEENKNELLPWLSETNQSLLDAAENTLEIEYGPIRLNKYTTELPSYIGIRDDIIEKITELTRMNNGVPIPQLEQLKKELIQQFVDVNTNAQQLQAVASTFDEQEKDLRKAIKASGEVVTKLREALIKCDDMSGDNAKIMQRLQDCKALKDQLLDQGNDIDNLRIRVDEMKSNYPTFAESIVPKELSNIQKRFDGVILHANKIEGALLQFLKKFSNDKVGMLQRMIATQKDKIAWCAPESTSDKYNLEVKKSSLNDVQKGIAECDGRLAEVQKSLDMLSVVDTPDVALKRNLEKISKDLNTLRDQYDTTKHVLDLNVDLWTQYEQLTENVTSWLKDIESKVKTEANSQIEVNNVESKVADLENYAVQIKKYKPTIDELDGIAKALMATNSEARVGQFVSHLTARYQAVSRNVANQLERVRDMKSTHDIYVKSAEECKDWIQDARMEFNELARMGSPGSGPTSEQLDLVKQFVKDLENGQILLNNAVDSGEYLYSGITPENREKIRNEIRKLREDFDNVHDEGNSLLSQVESVLLQKTSIEESYSQVKQWLSESKAKFSQTELYPTLAEKKAALQKFKSQLQDNNLHKSALKQLQSKASSLSDEEAEQRVAHSIHEYDTLSKNLNERIAILENQVANHEAYDQILEKSHDWLTALKAEATDILNEGTFEKDGAEEKLIVVENMIMQRPEGEKIFAACHKQLQTVLQQTHPKGHPALINVYESQKHSWDEFINLCEASMSKLKQLCSKWDEFENIIERLDAWLKQTENIVRDQSLKSTAEKKEEHLKKLNKINGEIASKAAEISNIVEQGHEIEGETDLNLRVSRLNTRYQTLKNICKESIGRYEVYTKEHKAFNNDYEVFKNELLKSIKDLENNGEVIGDYAILQDRQNKIRGMSEKRINDSTMFEALIDRGEKLYTHTSPDGREIIRQQLRLLRTSWDNFTDDLNSSTQKLDQCLLQFGEFTAAQEQLTKWLKDVEKSMEIHTELKATLQEKRAQLQNHKLMHQEIISHNALVESVCDKAQHLVDQTKDSSLNIYLQSIRQLFENIVSKSQDLLENLEGCAQAHHDFNVDVANLKSWLNSEMEKLLECDDTTGEKSDINRKLNSLELLKSNKANGDKMLNELLDKYKIVKKSTSPKGVEILNKELDDLRTSYANHYNDINSTDDKLRTALQQWKDFEKNLDDLTKWCRSSEAIFRDQQLQSTIGQKAKQLSVFKEQRENILQKQRLIDEFMDEASSLLNNSEADRLKPLISQLTNRHQLLQVLSKEVVNRWQTMVS